MKQLILVFTCHVLPLTTVIAQTDEAYAHHYNQKKGVAIHGYDPVSYFDDKPQKGDSKYAHTYKGVSYRFVSEDNLKQFKNNPESYTPQYGGWCAFAMGDYGDKVKVDPKTYKVTDGKLYLFYNFYLTNTLDDWNRDESNLIKKGDENWNSFLK